MARIVSKPASAQYRVNYDKIDWDRSPVSRGVKRFERSPEGRRLRKLLKGEVPFQQLDEGTKAAARVLRLAKTPRERDMFESLLRTSGKLANKDQIDAGRREVQKRVGW